MNARSLVLGGLLVLCGVAVPADADEAARIWSISIPTDWSEVQIPLAPDVEVEMRRMATRGGSFEVLGFRGTDASRRSRWAGGQVGRWAGGQVDLLFISAVIVVAWLIHEHKQRKQRLKREKRRAA